MPTPAYVSFFVVSAVLASCAKAEFAPIQVTGTGGNAGGGGEEVGPAADCETAAACVSSTGLPVDCPTNRLCHVLTTGQRPQKGEGCISPENDNCASGNVCLNFGDTSSYCFQLCSTSTQCDAVPCLGRQLDATTLVQVCDPKPTSCSSSTCCDPVNLTGCSGLTCYLAAPVSSSSPDSRTVCEAASGDKRLSDPCISSRECLPGLGCSLAPSATVGTCKKVCNPDDPATTCPCNPYNKQYGFCN
jgi:hypothetical protein